MYVFSKRYTINCLHNCFIAQHQINRPRLLDNSPGLVSWYFSRRMLAYYHSLGVITFLIAYRYRKQNATYFIRARCQGALYTRHIFYSPKVILVEYDSSPRPTPIGKRDASRVGLGILFLLLIKLPRDISNQNK